MHAGGAWIGSSCWALCTMLHKQQPVRYPGISSISVASMSHSIFRALLKCNVVPFWVPSCSLQHKWSPSLERRSCLPMHVQYDTAFSSVFVCLPKQELVVGVMRVSLEEQKKDRERSPPLNLKDDCSPREAFLNSFPSLNPFSAAALLTSTPFFHLMRMQPEEQQRYICLWDIALQS